MHWLARVHVKNLKSQGVEAGRCLQVVKGKRPTVDLQLRGASAAAAPESDAVAPGALLCGLVTDVSGALCIEWHCSILNPQLIVMHSMAGVNMLSLLGRAHASAHVRCAAARPWP